MLTQGGVVCNWAFYERHFSSVRLQHYLNEAKDDKNRASDLYRWNVNISGAFWESFTYFEIGFRNAIDTQLITRHSSHGRSGHWIFDDYYELGRDQSDSQEHKQPYKDIAEAIRRVKQNKKLLKPEQIISELSFGFWHQLVSQRQSFLWPDIATAFPYAPTRAQANIQDPIGRLRDLRNRIGHHHRIWSQNVSDKYKDMLLVAGYIDPNLASFIESQSQVPNLMSKRP